MIQFPTDAPTTSGYLAVPERGSGPGVLVLHAWWGLNSFFRQTCDRLAQVGFVALAPDLYHGALASTREEAERLSSALSEQQATADIAAALAFLRRHPAVGAGPFGCVGFSLGAAFALDLAIQRPEALGAVVVFYGTYTGLDYAPARAAFLGHFAEHDEWEPEENVNALEQSLQAAGKEVTFYRYPGTGHWFFEENRPDAYNAEAAALAWQRTLAFLRRHLAADPTPSTKVAPPQGTGD